ncbi:MAG: YceI family protein, partial [Alphaproteobacteria bacterium]|nr:YceI family protein [Alphaproteobacteria bacterium]
LGANRYRADGVLSLRGVKNQLSFPFSLTITPLDGGAKQATMVGDFTLNRLNFGIGQGAWKSTEAIGDSVNVQVHIVARASGI